MVRIYLASASPRRSQLLNQIYVAHDVRPVDLNEDRLAEETPDRYVERLAKAKAQALWKSLAVNDRRPVLGADTTVAVGNEIFGKPQNRDDGIAMLMQLSGRAHQVFTAVALQTAEGCDVRLSASEVVFGMLDESDCAAYWETGEPLGKAGGYAIQGVAAAFITRIAGSYSGIMGLPLAETADLLRTVGWKVPSENSIDTQLRR